MTWTGSVGFRKARFAALKKSNGKLCRDCCEEKPCLACEYRSWGNNKNYKGHKSAVVHPIGGGWGLFRAKEDHLSSSINKPISGNDWADFWTKHQITKKPGGVQLNFEDLEFFTGMTRVGSGVYGYDEDHWGTTEFYLNFVWIDEQWYESTHLFSMPFTKGYYQPQPPFQPRPIWCRFKHEEILDEWDWDDGSPNYGIYNYILESTQHTRYVPDPSLGQEPYWSTEGFNPARFYEVHVLLLPPGGYSVGDPPSTNPQYTIHYYLKGRYMTNEGDYDPTSLWLFEGGYYPDNRCMEIQGTPNIIQSQSHYQNIIAQQGFARVNET